MKKSGSAFLLPTAGSASTRTSKSCSKEGRGPPPRGLLPRRVRVVIHDDAPREAPEQLDLLLSEARAATCHHVADAGARHRDSIHVSFDEYRGGARRHQQRGGK